MPLKSVTSFVFLSILLLALPCEIFLFFWYISSYVGTKERKCKHILYTLYRNIFVEFF